MNQDGTGAAATVGQLTGRLRAPSVLAAFLVLLVALVWAAAFSYIRYDRHYAVEAIKKENANLVLAFEEHTVRTIKQIDQIALLVKHGFELRGSRPDLARFTWEPQFKPDLVLILAVTDERGDVVASSVQTDRVNLRDRENFQAHLAGDSGRLYIGKPALGRIARKWLIPMSRRINKPDGSFGGLVVVGIDPFYFSNFYKRIDLGRHGVVSLLGRDGVIRSRRSGLDADVGQDVSTGPMFRTMGDRPSGSMSVSSIIDGVTRIYSYRTLEEYPLAVTVGVDEAEALAEVTERKQYVYGTAAAINAFILLFSIWLLALHRREKQAEAEIRRLNGNLVTRAAELEAANQELESFSYSVAHDLRSPLRAMSGFGSILKAEHGAGLDRNGHRILQRIIDAATRMSDLIDGLLSLPRLTRGVMKRGTFDLSACVREVAQDLQQREPGRRVQWQVAGGVLAEGDPELLHVVIVHLLHNAWKFTVGRDPATIEFGAVRGSDGKPVYSVRDNGVGFDVAYSRHLFEPFQRLHNVEDYPGTGIGLATVQRIIRRHGGRIWAEGAPDGGATFFFTLSDADA